MKIIVISLPNFIETEAKQIIELFEAGVDYFHVRKPKADKAKVRQLICDIPEAFHCRLKLHYYSNLLEEFPLLNYHHSGMSEYNPELKRLQSKSFHNLSELRSGDPYDYAFISPVFESISKEGYHANINLQELNSHLLDNQITNVVALGGISEENVAQLKGLPLNGVSLLGSIWRVKPEDRPEYIKRIREIIS